MAVTNNPNSIILDKTLTPFSVVATVPFNYSIQGESTLQLISIVAAIANSLAADVALVSVSGTMGTSQGITASIDVPVSLSIDGSIVTIPLISGNVSTLKVEASGTLSRSVSIDGSFLIKTVSAVSGSAYFGTLIDGQATVFKVTMDAGCSQSTIVGTVEKVIVLNLRTKSHTTYESGALNTTATTGELSFGTLNNKNLSDMFVLGRGEGSIEVGVKNDETTLRDYVVDYRNANNNLVNKKVKLSKGLVGNNWQLTFKNQDQSFCEVRNVDVFVNQLRRHV